MPDRRDEFDELLDDFDRQWQEGFAPGILDFIASFEKKELARDERRYLLIESLRIDIEYRWNRLDESTGLVEHNARKATSLPQRPLIEDYLRVLRLNDDMSPSELADLIKDEFRARCLSGHSVELEEYRERFPALPSGFESQLKNISKQLQAQQTPSGVDQMFGFTTAHSSAFSSGSIPPAGVEFGGYLVLDRIGSGAMGLVFHARQSRPGRDVALKVIRSGAFATRAEIRRLYREAEAAARLDHKGIVPIYEVGREGPLHYFSMAYVDGSDLERIVRDRPMSPADAASLLASVADAVHYAHEQGVVHRDLKPGNILVGRDGQPRVTDFGLARQFAADERLTVQGEVLGTPGYMPPEQAAGESRNVNAAGDIYSLGAVLYRIVTGRPPFQAATQLETIQQVLENDPVSPRLLNRAIPRDLENIILKCLEKDPARRYRTAQDLVEDLGRFLRGDPTAARPLGPIKQLLRTIRRNPRPVLLALGITLFVGIIGYREWGDALSEFVNRRALSLNRRQLESLRQQLTGQQQEHTQQLKYGDLQRYILLSRNAKKLIDLDQCASAIEVLKEQIQANETMSSHSGWELDYLMRVADSDDSNEIESRPANLSRKLGVLAMAIDPTNEVLAAGSQESAIVLLHGKSQNEFTVVPTWLRVVRSLAFSPDAKMLAACGEVVETRSNVLLIDTSSPNRDLLEFTCPNSNPIAVAFLQDSHALLTADDEGQFVKWNTATGQPTELTNLRTSVRAVEVSRDGLTAVVATSDGHTLILNLANGMILRDIEEAAMQCAINPHGNQVAILTEAGNLKVFEGRWDETTTKVNTFGQNDLLTLCFSPDGRLLATGGAKGDIHIRDAYRHNELTSIQMDGELVQTLAFAPDGRYIVAGSKSGLLKRWGLAGAIADIGYPTEHKKISAIEVSEADRTVILAGDGGAIRVCSIDRPYDSRLIGVHPSRDASVVDPAGVYVLDLDVDASSGIVASVCALGSVYLCNSRRFSSNPIPKHLVNASKDVTCVEFRTGHRQLACGSADGAIRLWSVENDSPIMTFTGHKSNILAIQFTSDGSQAVSCDDSGKLLAWNPDDGSVNWSVEHPNIATLEIDHQDEIIAAGPTGEVVFLDIASGRVLHNLQLAVSTNSTILARLGGNRLATITQSSSVQIRDRNSGLSTLDLPVDGERLVGIAVLPDGIVAAAESGNLYCWRGKSRLPVQPQQTLETIPVIVQP